MRSLDFGGKLVRRTTAELDDTGLQYVFGSYKIGNEEHSESNFPKMNARCGKGER